jgi:hypothetical protein
MRRASWTSLHALANALGKSHHHAAVVNGMLRRLGSGKRIIAVSPLVTSADKKGDGDLSETRQAPISGSLPLGRYSLLR